MDTMLCECLIQLDKLASYINYNPKGGCSERVHMTNDQKDIDIQWIECNKIIFKIWDFEGDKCSFYGPLDYDNMSPW
jgi:hypothetical protein